MSKQSGISSLLAAAASLLIMGMVAVGTAAPAQAASEEDLAAPRGAFVSTMAVPNDRENGVTLVRAGHRPALIVTASEEDAAVPPGAFTSTMAAPRGPAVRLAATDNAAKTSVSEIVAAGLE